MVRRNDRVDPLSARTRLNTFPGLLFTLAGPRQPWILSLDDTVAFIVTWQFGSPERTSIALEMIAHGAKLDQAPACETCWKMKVEHSHDKMEELEMLILVNR